MSQIYPALAGPTSPITYYAIQPDSAYVSPPSVAAPAVVSTPPPASVKHKLKGLLRSLTSSLTLENDSAQPRSTTAESTLPPPTVASAPVDEDRRPEPTYGLLVPVVAPVSRTAFYQQISNRVSVQKLLQQNISVDALMQEGIQLHHFYEAGYSLRDLTQLVPNYQCLKMLGLNKHLVGGRWSLMELCQLYGIGLGPVCADLEFRAPDLLRAKLGAPELQAMGLTVDKLLWMGADFTFLLQLRCSPGDFQHRLGGTFENLAKFQLNMAQKLALGQACGWSPFAMAGTLGFTVENVQDLWYSLDDLPD